MCVLQVCVFLNHSKREQRNPENQVSKRYLTWSSPLQARTGAKPSHEVSELVSYVKSLGLWKISRQYLHPKSYTNYTYQMNYRQLSEKNVKNEDGNPATVASTSKFKQLSFFFFALDMSTNFLQSNGSY